MAEIGARLEKAVSNLPGEPTDAQDLYNRWEEMAIQILDCRHTDFGPELEAYLRAYLHLKALELGLSPDSQP